MKVVQMIQLNGVKLAPAAPKTEPPPFFFFFYKHVGLRMTLERKMPNKTFEMT